MKTNSSLALFKNSVSYEIGAQLLNSAVTDLHVITVPTGGLLIDLLTALIDPRVRLGKE